MKEKLLKLFAQDFNSIKLTVTLMITVIFLKEARVIEVLVSVLHISSIHRFSANWNVSPRFFEACAVESALLIGVISNSKTADDRKYKNLKQFHVNQTLMASAPCVIEFRTLILEMKFRLSFYISTAVIKSCTEVYARRKFSSIYQAVNVIVKCCTQKNVVGLIVCLKTSYQ